MARFKVVHEMKSRGMKGKFAHGYTSAGNRKHYKFRTTSIRRETHKPRDEYKPHAGNILLPEISEKDMLESISAASVAYDRFLKDL